VKICKLGFLSSGALLGFNFVILCLSSQYLLGILNVLNGVPECYAILHQVILFK